MKVDGILTRYRFIEGHNNHNGLVNWRWGCKSGFICIFRNVMTILSLYQLTCLFGCFGGHCHFASRRSAEASIWCIVANLGPEIRLSWIVSFQDALKLFFTNHFKHRILFMGGTSCIIIGFSFATEFGCECVRVYCNRSISFIVCEGASPPILSLLIIGFLLLLCGGYHERHTSRECLFPPTTFNDLSAGFLLPSISRIYLNISSGYSNHHVLA